MMDMRLLDIDPYITRLFDDLRKESLADQVALAAEFDRAARHHTAETRRRIAYEMKVKRIRNVDIAQRLNVDPRSINRYVREWCESRRLPIPRYGIAEGDEILVTSPDRAGGTATR